MRGDFPVCPLSHQNPGYSGLDPRFLPPAGDQVSNNWSFPVHRTALTFTKGPMPNMRDGAGGTVHQWGSGFATSLVEGKGPWVPWVLACLPPGVPSFCQRRVTIAILPSSLFKAPISFPQDTDAAQLPSR